MSLFDALFKKIIPNAKIPEYHEKTYSVVGAKYYMNNISKLACPNPYYKKSVKDLISDGKISARIFQYTYINKPVKLVPESKNPHDKNAVSVYIAGELVGYISADNALEVRSILKSDIMFISSFVSGGKYKIVHPDGLVEKCEHDIHITLKIGYSA